MLKSNNVIWLISLIFFLFTVNIFAQSQNIKLVANINDHADRGYTDCWGYTSPNGDEYVLLGVNGGVSIVSVTDTTNISEVAYIPWVNGSWYDLKTYKNYAYVSSESSLEVLIIDLANLPASAPVVGSFAGSISTSNLHNIFIDTTMAIIYTIEDLHIDPSVRLFSLADPLNPTELSIIHPGINGKDVHDVFARDSVLYIAEGGDPSIGIYDVSDPADPFLMSRLTIPNAGYVHNVWVTKDKKYMVTTEETVGRTVKLWDIQDLDNIELLSEYLGESNLAHNAFFYENHIYISHYESGVKVLDFSDPQNIFEVGNYDTYPQTNNSSFSGAWGIYPFTQNGLLYANDMQSGLFVLEFERRNGPQIIMNDFDFGNVLMGTVSDTHFISIKNFGTEELTITSISDPGEPFNLFDIPEMPFNVKPGEIINLSTTFSAAELGRDSSTITITSNDTVNPSVIIKIIANGFVINEAEAGLFYAGGGNEISGRLLQINKATGHTVTVGPTGLGDILGIAVNSRGELFCATLNDPVLYRLDAASGGALKEVETSINIGGLAFGDNDILYGAQWQSSNLYTIDIATGEVTDLGDTGLAIIGMAFDPATGDLWVSTFSNDIHKIDLMDLSSERIGSFGTGPLLTGVEFDPLGNLFGLMGLGVTDFVSISKHNGDVDLIGSTALASPFGFTTIQDTFWNVKIQSASINATSLAPGSDTLKIKSKVLNPGNHNLTVRAIIESFDKSVSDTVKLFDDGAHNDSTAGDNIFGSVLAAPQGKRYFTIKINAFPTEVDYLNNYLFDAALFSNGGPVRFDHFSITSADTVPNPGDNLRFDLLIKNTGQDSVFNISAHVTSLDSCVEVFALVDRVYGDIAPGEIAEPNRNISFSFAEECPAGTFIPIAVDFFSDGMLFWRDTFYVHLDSVVVGIEDKDSAVPNAFALKQNFPNPFNPETTISYQIAQNSYVDLSVFNLLGQKVATLLSQNQPAGFYDVIWDATGFSSGVYLYKLETDKGFIQTRKLILLK